MSGKSDTKQLPLWNKTIVITRGKRQAKEFSELLERYGARVLLFPALEIVVPQTYSECDSALAKLGEYSGIIFTSSNAVEYFFRRAKYQRTLDQLKKCRVYAIGDKTKNEIDAYGMQTEKIPEVFSAEQLAHDIVKTSVAGERFLFPKGNLAKSDVETILSSYGIVVDAVTVYCTQEPPFDDERKKMMKTIEEKADLITFFSPSSVAHFVRRASLHFVKKIDVAVIGETTDEAARHEGMNVVLVSPQPTSEVFAEAIQHFYTTSK